MLVHLVLLASAIVLASSSGAAVNPPPTTSFWTWPNIINAGVACGTLGVTVLALWGKWLEYHIFGPKLTLSLFDPSGHPTVSRETRDGTIVGQHSSRYYHLQIRNKRKWALAKNVRVLLTDCKTPVADGSFSSILRGGPLQLAWQYHAVKPSFYRDIGPVSERCDVACLEQNPTSKRHEFRITCLFWPNDFEPTLREKGSLVISVKAAAVNGESPPLHLRIDWNGKYSETTADMAKNLIICEVKPA